LRAFLNVFRFFEQGRTARIYGVGFRSDGPFRPLKQENFFQLQKIDQWFRLYLQKRRTGTRCTASRNSSHTGDWNAFGVSGIHTGGNEELADTDWRILSYETQFQRLAGTTAGKHPLDPAFGCDD
jgi:hypothetical protein